MSASSATPGEVFLSVIIAICCYCDLLVCSPPSPLRDALLDKVHPALDYVSLLPRFNMFSPDPPRMNWFLDADITYADGTVKRWRYPDLNSYRYDFWLPQVKVRYQYWRAYVSVRQRGEFLVPGCAAYAARVNDSPNNHPVRVRLYLVHQDISLPGQPAQDEVREEMCDYSVKPGDLQ